MASSSPANFAGICPLEPDVVGEAPATSAYPSFSWASGSVCAARGHQRTRTRRPIPNLDSFRLSHACSCCPLQPAARVYRSPRARPAGSGNAQDPRLQGAAASRRTASPPRSSLPLAFAQSASQRSQPETSPACAAAILRLSGARWRRGSTSPSRPDAHSPCPEPSTPSFARPRHSRASREVDVRLTCVAIVSCDHVVSVV